MQLLPLNASARIVSSNNNVHNVRLSIPWGLEVLVLTILLLSSYLANQNNSFSKNQIKGETDVKNHLKSDEYLANNQSWKGNMQTKESLKYLL